MPRYLIERTYTVGPSPVIDVSTTRGKINIRTGEAGHVVVSGAATVRLGLTTPSAAAELARKVAANPPIEQNENRLRLRSPLDPDERRATTVNYEIRVPPDARVIAASDSGASCPVSANSSEMGMTLDAGRTVRFDLVGNQRAQDALKNNKRWSKAISENKPIRAKVSGVLSGDKLIVSSIN